MHEGAALRPAPAAGMRWRQICGAVGGLLLLFLSSGCIGQQLIEYQRRIQEAMDAVPSVNVRIVNQTDVPARVMFDAGITPPQTGTIFDIIYPGDTLLSVGGETVVVAAGGTATGAVKCGEVIGIAAITPGDVEAYLGTSAEAFGLWMSGGNIVFTGAGASQGSDFTGDVQPTGVARFVRPSVDGLNCGSGTLVVEILTPGTLGTYSPQSGTYTGGTNGTGTIAIE
jgi:hypothetical protein